jgi:hypothetical protein
MHFDLGLQGLGILAGCALIGGAVAQVVFWKSTPKWTGLAVAGTWFGCGLLISEVMFGTATEKDLQPIIDGLAFDESLLAIVPSVLVLVGVWFLSRRTRHSAAA